MSFGNDDPFASQSTPSVSWKGAPTGTTLTIELTKPASKVEYGNWQDGKPKSHAVVNGTVKAFSHDSNIVGEERSVWATIPSSLFKAIQSAQTQAGQKLDARGILHIKITGETPTGKGNPKREFAAKYEPPAASDAFTEDEPPF